MPRLSGLLSYHRPSLPLLRVPWHMGLLAGYGGPGRVWYLARRDGAHPLLCGSGDE